MARFGRAYPAPIRTARPPLSTLPPGPVELRVTTASPTKVSVAWDEPPADGLLGYGVYLDGSKVGADQAERVATFTSLVEGHTYLIEVDTSAALGRSDPTPLTVTTPDVTEPSTPTRLTTVAATRTTLTVEWAASTDNVAVAGYGIWLNGDRQSADQTALSCTFEGLAAGQPYVVEVDATDQAGNRSPRAVLETATLPDMPPSTPPDLHVTGVTYTSIAVSWGESTDEDPIAGYDVGFDGDHVATARPGEPRSSRA